jgi:hypothetical protein
VDIGLATDRAGGSKDRGVTLGWADGGRRARCPLGLVPISTFTALWPG